MSRTIEIVSINIGPVALCTKRGEQRTVVFQDKGGVGFAMCDEDEAEILLGGIGKPDYWKPGQNESGTPAPIAIPGETNENGQDTDTEPAGELTKEKYETIKNVGELKTLLQTTNDSTLVMELIAIEAQRESSKATWMNALNDRLDELNK